MIVTLENARNIDMQGWICIVPNKFVSQNKYFITNCDIFLQLSNEKRILIKQGFQFDGSSSPRFLWWLFPTYGAFLFAALIHDWMYVNDYHVEILGVKSARKLADKEMLLWSNELNDKKIWDKIDNYLRYIVVRIFGKQIYLK